MDENKTEVKVEYAYIVYKFENGKYDFVGLPLEENGEPTIDKLGAAQDIIQLAPKLDRQLLTEEIRAQILKELSAMANAENHDQCDCESCSTEM